MRTATRQYLSLIVVGAYLALTLGASAHVHAGYSVDASTVDLLTCSPENANEVGGTVRTGHVCAVCASAIHVGPPLTFAIVPPTTRPSSVEPWQNPHNANASHAFSLSRRGPPVLLA